MPQILGKISWHDGIAHDGMNNGSAHGGIIFFGVHWIMLLLLLFFHAYHTWLLWAVASAEHNIAGHKMDTVDNEPWKGRFLSCGWLMVDGELWWTAKWEYGWIDWRTGWLDVLLALILAMVHLQLTSLAHVLIVGHPCKWWPAGTWPWSRSSST